MNNIRRVVRPATHAAARNNWYESPWKIAGRAIGAALAILVVGVLLALVVVPRLLGGDSLTVLSGSMEPTFAPGDVVVVKGIAESDVCTDIAVGDIVSYFPKPNDSMLITHRVIGKTIGTFEDGTRCRLITQGDANSTIDEAVSPAQVRGVFLYGIPKLGWVRQWVGDNSQLVLFGAVGVVVVWGLWSTFRRPRTTVSVIPRSSGEPSSSVVTPSVATPITPAEPGIEQQLRERELVVRERELELRERELAFALQQSPSSRPDYYGLSDTALEASVLGSESLAGESPSSDLPNSDLPTSQLPAIQRIEA